MAQVVSLNPSPNHTLRAALTVNGAALTLNLALRWNAQSGFWALDIADQAGNPLVSSVPLLTGIWPAANILAPYDYLKIGSAYIVNQSGADGEPDETNLGASYLLLWDDN